MLGRRNNKARQWRSQWRSQWRNAQMQSSRREPESQAGRGFSVSSRTGSHHHCIISTGAACGFVYHTDVTETFLLSRVSRVESSESEAGSFLPRLCAAERCAIRRCTLHPLSCLQVAIIPHQELPACKQQDTRQQRRDGHSWCSTAAPYLNTNLEQ